MLAPASVVNDPAVAPSTSIPEAQRNSTFSHAITLIFTRWTALQLSLQNIRDEKDTLAHMHSETLDFFRRYGDQVYPDELRDNFETYFDQVFNVDLEDGSAAQVGRELVKLYKEIVKEGKADSYNRLRELLAGPGGSSSAAASRILNQIVDEQGNPVEDDSSDEDDDDWRTDDGNDITAPTASDGVPGPAFSTASTAGSLRSRMQDLMDVDPEPAQRQGRQTVSKREKQVDEDGFELVYSKGKKR
ncbi:hypothetical protein HDU93_003768 [Gonapodya sp. JEL0774]|nr:hypothetical protein HDU93_003768 [Gonapodya sp. JEL0774]